MQLTIKDRNDLQQLRAELPPIQPFASVEECHQDFMQNCVAPALAEAKAAGCYPDEKLFVESLKEVWLSVYSRYAPTKAAAA